MCVNGATLSSLQETGFFRSWGGSWDTPYGAFFLSWYAGALAAHGERLIRLAAGVFNTAQPAACTLSNHRNSSQSIVNAASPGGGQQACARAARCCLIWRTLVPAVADGCSKRAPLSP